MDLSISIILVLQSEALEETLLQHLRDSQINPTYQRIRSVKELSRILDQRSWDILVADQDSTNISLSDILTALDEKELPLPCIVIDPPFSKEIKEFLRRGRVSACVQMDELNDFGSIVKQVLSKSRNMDNERNHLSTLSVQEEHMKDFITNAPIGIFRSTKDGAIVYGNPKLAEILGYASVEDFLTSIKNVTTEVYADPNKREQIIERMFADNDWIHDEIKMKRKDGSLIDIDLTGRKVMKEDGSLNFFEGYIEDITERKRAHETLRRNEKQFRAYFEQGSDGVVIIDPENGNFIDFNNRACQQLGYSREEFAHLNLTNIESEETPEMVFAHIHKVLAEGIDTFETRQRTKKGEIRNVQVTAQIINADQQPIYYCIWRDITEHKQAELTLELIKNRLIEAQSVSNTGSWDLDLITKEMWGSEEAHNIYGLEQTPGLRLPLALAQSLVEPEFRPMMNQALNDLISSKGATPYDVEYYIRRHNDGARRAIHSRARIICDQGGNPLRVAGTIQDITDRKQIEENIRKLNDELEQRVKERTNQLEVALKELEAFSYSVSHDLRAPLRTLNGYSSILINDYSANLDEQARLYLRQIQQSANLMDQLINDMHNLSRITRVELDLMPVDLSRMALEISAELQKETPKQKMKFKVDQEMSVKGDAHLLKIMLENLMCNAVKFSAKNESGSMIHVGKLIENGKEVYFVRDNGVGFDMTYKDKLFQPFQRLHAVNEFSGTGIGLSIVQRIIQRHNGSVWAESQPGQGATFYFTIG